MRIWWAEPFAKAVLIAAESTRNKAGERRGRFERAAEFAYGCGTGRGGIAPGGY